MIDTAKRPHPLYLKAAAGDYISPAETGRLIRERLARAYPGVTFYVRTSTYSMGASVRISYDGIRSHECLNGHPVPDAYRCATCGLTGPNAIRTTYAPGAPTRAQVEEITAPYAGSRFDGMIDLAYSVRAWITPDGNAFFGRSDGTYGSHGSDPGYDEPRPVPGAVAVHFSAGYVFVDPELPYDVTHKAEEEARKARARARKAAGWHR